jgi:hypothetical protein
MKNQTLRTINRAIWGLTEGRTLGSAAAEASCDLIRETEEGEFVNEKRVRPLAVQHLGAERLLALIEHAIEELKEEGDTKAGGVISMALEEEEKPHLVQLEKAREMKKRLERIIGKVEGQIFDTVYLDYTEDRKPVDGLHEEIGFS